MDKKIINRKVIYEGLFVVEEDYNEECAIGHIEPRVYPLGNPSLEHPISHPHITVVFKPEKPHNELYGRDVFAIVNGYGCNGVNEGYRVRIIPRGIHGQGDYIGCPIHSYDEDCFHTLIGLIKNIKVPHITLSVSADGCPKDTEDLAFELIPIEEQFIIQCRYGAFVEIEYDDGTKETDYDYSGRW